MIIGYDEIPVNEVKSFIGKPNDFVAYVDSLIPMWARHIDSIISNQRYFVALHVRRMLSLPYKERMDLVNALVRGIRIKGTTNTFVPITHIVRSCNLEALADMLEMEMRDELHGRT